MKILLIYSTTDGHTVHICDRLQKRVEDEGHQITRLSIDEAEGVELAGFDKIVIGASIRYGKHNPKVAHFVNKNAKLLDSLPNAFFSVNVVARKPEKNAPATNPYLKKFLQHIKWTPKELAVFAGKIDYPKYSFFDRQMIRFIMWMTKGPTDPKAVVEFTDWAKVDEFAKVVAKM